MSEARKEEARDSAEAYAKAVGGELLGYEITGSCTAYITVALGQKETTKPILF